MKKDSYCQRDSKKVSSTTMKELTLISSTIKSNPKHDPSDGFSIDMAIMTNSNLLANIIMVLDNMPVVEKLAEAVKWANEKQVGTQRDNVVRYLAQRLMEEPPEKCSKRLHLIRRGMIFLTSFPHQLNRMNSTCGEGTNVKLARCSAGSTVRVLDELRGKGLSMRSVGIC